MTPEYRAWLDNAFAEAYPRAIDFRQPEFEASKTEFGLIASQHGYRLAGVRLERAVFTTKPTPQEEIA